MVTVRRVHYFNIFRQIKSTIKTKKHDDVYELTIVENSLIIFQQKFREISFPIIFSVCTAVEKLEI